MRAEVIGQTLNLHRDLLRVAVCQIWVNFLFCIFTLVERLSCIYTVIVCGGFQHGGERWATPLGHSALSTLTTSRSSSSRLRTRLPSMQSSCATLMSSATKRKGRHAANAHWRGWSARARARVPEAVIAPTLATLALVSGTMIVDCGTIDRRSDRH